MLTQRDARVIELLPDIKVPSLIVVGADDTPFLAASDYMAAKIPGARFIAVESPNHLLLESDPGWPKYARIVEEFLEIQA